MMRQKSWNQFKKTMAASTLALPHPERKVLYILLPDIFTQFLFLICAWRGKTKVIIKILNLGLSDICMSSQQKNI